MVIDNNILRNLIREGIVSSVNAKDCTIRVTFPDKDDFVSAELKVVCNGSGKNKDYWLPDVDESVVCLFLPNSKNGNNVGYCLGTVYNAKDRPPAADQNKRIIRFSDNTSIEYDRATHQLSINCVGDIVVNGRNIYLNE